MEKRSNELLKIFLIPGIFFTLIWVIGIIQLAFKINLYSYGILPGKISGLIGIITSPLIHSGINHLLSNTLPILLLSTGTFYFYKSGAVKISLFIYLLSGLSVWLFARPAYHVGASGLIYGFSSFLFFSGVIRKDARSIAIALIVVFLYGGMIWGILPASNGISWESHLFGGLAGLAASIIFRKSDTIKKYDWEDEEYDTPVEKLEISYDKRENWE